MTEPPGLRTALGVMTGTSLDGLDAARMLIAGEGLAMAATLVGRRSEPLGAIAAELRAFAEGAARSAGEIAALAWSLGERHAEIVAGLLGDGVRPDLVAAHGQTVVHDPPRSWQLLNPAPIAARFGCPVVCDFRQCDLAAGGRGAPITPLADQVLFGRGAPPRAIVNLGGFCNVTVLPGVEGPEALPLIRGFDVCACDQVLDRVARAVLGAPFDDGGRAAAEGRTDQRATAALRALLEAQRAAGRSLGTGDECGGWVETWRTRIPAPDLAASAATAIATTIAAAVSEHGVAEVVVAGGGTRHAPLVAGVRERSRAPVRMSDELGVPVEAREAMAIAVLGALSADGVPLTLPGVTGCAEPAPQGGVWTGGPSRAGH